MPYPLRVGEERWIYIHHYSPLLRGIAVYSLEGLLHEIGLVYIIKHYSLDKHCQNILSYNWIVIYSMDSGIK